MRYSTPTIGINIDMHKKYFQEGLVLSHYITPTTSYFHFSSTPCFQ